MTIQILPARLANQIAAGEVVERPASVVKELVENSLDAGATRIDIEIDRGGMQRIQLRDNGSGIPKDELGLALSRHATSKIASLEDLEAILSLGFRGEALASISSVSRLSLVSRTAEQTEAWEAYAEGRDMAVVIKPASHPVGTTLTVLDLFFNTPARRKFLRSEKTEFTHIDEVLKRIALSRFDVVITLKHNGKLVRQYRAASEQVQKERRLAAVCGQGFVNEALAVSLEHLDLKLSGWVGTPQAARSQSDLQYCYVNGRIMRDKVINHAIRQAYEQRLPSDKHAAYVLFIEIDPHQIDVNVHPAKHEVRFHQGRLVHDFILQGIQTALNAESDLPPLPHSPPPLPEDGSSFEYEPATASEYTGRASEVRSPEPIWAESVTNYPNANPMSTWSAPSDSSSNFAPSREEKTSHSKHTDFADKKVPSTFSPSAQSAYRDLLKAPPAEPASEVELASESSSVDVSSQKQSTSNAVLPKALGKPLTVLDGQFVLLQSDDLLSLLSLREAEKLLIRHQFKAALSGKAALSPQPLLIPQRLPVSVEEQQMAMAHLESLNALGINFKLQGKTHLTILAVPSLLRQQNLQHFVPWLLTWCQSEDPQSETALTALVESVACDKVSHSLASAIRVLNDLEQAWGRDLPHYYPILLRPLPVQPTLDSF